VLSVRCRRSLYCLSRKQNAIIYEKTFKKSST
jgi:hypothetical protein